MNWRLKSMATATYNLVQRNQPLVIGTSALDLNYNDFYCIVRDSYNKMVQHENAELIEILPTQANIRMIQQIYLDLVNSKEPLVICGVNINFADDVWDFTSKYKAGKVMNLYTFDFNTSAGVSDYHNVLMKLFVIYCITEYGLHNGTNKGRFDEIKRLMEYMQANNKMLVDNMSLNDYKDFYEKRNIKYTSMVKSRRHVKEFLTFYSIIAKDVYTKELSQWFNDIDTATIKADIENNKTPLLPTSFYTKYSTKLYTLASDTNEDKWNRGYYGLLYIGTQTGLRVSELTLLRVQDLEVRTFRGKKIGILHYRSTKSGNGKGHVYDDAETNANQKVIAIYEILEALFKEDREKLKVDYLVPRNMDAAPNGRDKTKRSQTTGGVLETTSKRLCVKNCIEWDLLNTKDKDSFGGAIVYDSTKRSDVPQSLFASVGVKDGDVISYPIVKQFRVYVASELRERGIDDRTTAFLFNHHSVEMYGYYARPKHSVQEDIDFSREIVADVVRDGTKILGPKGDALTAKIDKIIEENNFNVETDLDAIIEKVCNEVPIRAKSGGFCMKSNPRRECRHDAKTDEFMCAYGCCPNHCHMYFMLPVSYEKVKILHKTYEYNVQAGFTNAADKEAFKLNFAINSELMPELVETRNELTKRTADDIIKAHPEMATVIDRLDEIEKEVKAWKQQIEKN